MEMMLRMGIIPSAHRPIRKLDLIQAELNEQLEEALDAGDLDEYDRVKRELSYLTEQRFIRKP